MSNFLAGLVPQFIWDALGTAGALWAVWPWLLGIFLAGLLIGAWIGRWAVAAVFGIVIGGLLLLRGGPEAVKTEQEVTKARKRRVITQKKEATKTLTWFERMRLGQ